MVLPRPRGVVIRLDERRGSKELGRDECPQGLWFILVVTLLSLAWRFPW